AYNEFKNGPDSLTKPYFDALRAQSSLLTKRLSAGPELRNYIGALLHYNPTNLAATQPGAPLQDWYGGKELEIIAAVERRIVADNGRNPSVTLSAIPLLYAHKDAGVQPTALFAVEREGMPRSFVDDRGATYTDWQNFLENNSFSPDGEFHLAPEM